MLYSDSCHRSKRGSYHRRKMYLSCGCETAAPATDRSHEGGRNLCGPTEGRSEASGMGRKEKRVNIGGNVETCGQESIRAPISRKGSFPHLEVGPRNHSKLEGQHATASRGSGSRGGGATWVGPPTPPGILAPDKGVVSGCGRPYPLR